MNQPLNELPQRVPGKAWLDENVMSWDELMRLEAAYPIVEDYESDWGEFADPHLD